MVWKIIIFRPKKDMYSVIRLKMIPTPTYVLMIVMAAIEKLTILSPKVNTEPYIGVMTTTLDVKLLGAFTP